MSLIPRLSAGSETPQSIYEARFDASLTAHAPDEAEGLYEVALPMPPQVISLSDVSIQLNGKPSEEVTFRDGKLAWRGDLSADPCELDVTYTAVGRGIYELSMATDGLIDQYNITLHATGSDVRLMELSLQPTNVRREAGTNTYEWNYSRLMIGRPVHVDVLGIAPIDRLGELTWLGPLSVVVFGLLLGLAVQAEAVPNFDRWMLLLTIGTFAGAYPLMYFAQEYLSLLHSILASVAFALSVIGIRALTLMSAKRAILGIVLPAAIIMGVALSAAVWPHSQGLLLTGLALAGFITSMMLLPHISPEKIWGPPRRSIAPATH